MANEVPGVRVPDAVLDRMRRVSRPKPPRPKGVAIAREVGCALKGVVQGTHVAAPSGRVEAALEVLAAVQTSCLIFGTSCHPNCCIVPGRSDDGLGSGRPKFPISQQVTAGDDANAAVRA